MKKIRDMHVYGYESKWDITPPEIRIKAKWLREYGFKPYSPIKVKCYNGKLIITLDKTKNM